MRNSLFPPLSKTVPSLALLLVLAGAGWAPAQTAEELHATRRSSFEAPAGARDPLTPIGWQKPQAAGEVANPHMGRAVESYLVPAAFVVSSISLDRIPLAVVNGKAYGEGDIFPFTAGGEKVQLQVFAIRDGAVTLRYKAFQVVCPIRGQQPSKPKTSAAGP